MKKPDFVIGSVSTDVPSALVAGTAVIGAVTTITNPVDVSGSSISISNVGDIAPAAPLDTAVLDDGTTLTVKFARGSSAGAGDNTAISAVVGKKIRILSFALSAAAAVTATWKSDLAGSATSISIDYILALGQWYQSPEASKGFFETASGKALNLYLSAALTVTWNIAYVEV